MRGGEYKCRVSKMRLKLRDQHIYIKREILLYKNFMVTVNQKSIIDIHIKEKRNPNITLKRREQKKKGGKRSTKQLIKWQ